MVSFVTRSVRLRSARSRPPGLPNVNVQSGMFSAASRRAATCGGRIFLRDSANRIWTYGAVDPADVPNNYNNCHVDIRLPYLDGKKPGHKKTFQAIDATVNSLTPAMAPEATGAWRIAISYDFNNPEQEETVGTITQSTWNIGANELTGYDSHYSLRFYNDDEFPATLSNVAVHYNMADDEA